MVKNRKDLTPRRNRRVSLIKPKSGACANIRVVVRVRPLNDKEEGNNCRVAVKVVDEQMLVFDPEEDATPFFYHGVQVKGRDLLKKTPKNMKFSFDRVFTDESDNDEVFQHSTKDLIKILMEGCNCSVFVYGATGAGKTHTMLGNNNSPGITFLTMRELFRQKEELLCERSFELAVSYLEVYNENVQDLLKPNKQSMHLREDGKLGVMVAGLTIQRIQNPEDLFDLLEQGNRFRTQHPTDANAESSRSHAVFQVYIRMNIKATGQTRLAKLSMIDLAGSERAAATGCKGARFTEGANINKSLLALGNCINSLADGHRHIPYRDSKLTRLLKDSLGGNCHTVMIANVSPSSLSFEDTYNTLKYATRAKKIKSNVTKNVMNNELKSAQYVKIIDDLNKEILRLKEEQKTKGVCETCKDGIQSTAIDSVKSAELKSHFANYISSQERLQKLMCNKSTLEARVHLKEEANNRLSGFCADTPDKEKGHKKLTQTMDRLKKQVDTFQLDCTSMQNQLKEIKEQISEMVKENPELQCIADLEQAKLDKMIAEREVEEIKNVFAIKDKELQIRGVLLEDMAALLKPWYLILRHRDITTDAMTKEYQSLLARLQGACNVTFEDDDSGVSTVSSVPSIVIEEESRPGKRKLPNELDSTYVLSPTSNKNIISANHILGKVYPTPPKRMAVKTSPRRIMKENKTVLRKPVGTMGTSSRFPSINVNNRKPLRKPLQRTKI